MDTKFLCSFSITFSDIINIAPWLLCQKLLEEALPALLL